MTARRRRRSGATRDRFPDTGLQRGFAVVTTDAGHQGATADFGLDPVARVDHAYAAHERTYTIAMAIQSRYYGRAPDHKYFVGCSGGGRQGMMFAQRYPTYFDGIAICAPAMSVSSGATIAAAWDTQTYIAAAPADANGQRVISRAFSDADLALVARGITAACDAADGAVDGMVLRPEACRFDPKTLRCAGEKNTNCLTSEQVGSLERAFGGPRTSSGRALYVGQPGIPDRCARMAAVEAGLVADRHAELGEHDADGGRARVRVRHAARPVFVDRAVRLRSRSRADAGVLAGLRHLPRRDARRIPRTRRQAADLHGTADPIFSALESIDYYQRLTRNNGGPNATVHWARLFLVPGMNHCAGGPATDRFDGLLAIVDWVEKGAAPARIDASASPRTTYFPGRTRPLCPYPAYARYSGTGSLEDGAHFTCVAPSN